MVAYTYLAAAAALSQGASASRRYVRASPPQQVCPAPVTLNQQPLVVEIHKPVYVTGYLPTPTAINIGDGTTLTFPNAPTEVSTVVTKTIFDTTTLSR